MNIMIANSPEGHEHDAELDGEAGEADEAEPDGGGDLHEGLFLIFLFYFSFYHSFSSGWPHGT